MAKLTINMVSESEISVQGHGVHTAYIEMLRALQARSDVTVIPGKFGERVTCDIIHLHTIGPRVWRKLFQKGPKKVVSAHVVPDSFVGSLVGARWWRGVATVYLRWFYNHADLLLAVSASAADELRQINVTAPIMVLDNAIDTSRYRTTDATARQRIRRQLGITAKDFVVIGAGQVQPRKRVDRFVAAALACPDMQFVWVGGMPFGKVAADYATMQKLMSEAPKNLHFPGIISLEDMPSYYHAADVFWLPSDQETFGLVVVEAAASGLPVLLRDISDYQATFAPYALLVSDTTDIKALKKLHIDHKVYREYQAKATELADRFDSVAATDTLVAAYRNLL